MRLDLTNMLVDPKGEPFRLNGADKPMSLGDALYHAVTTSPKCGAGGNPAERRERGRLADVLTAEGVVTLSAGEEAVLREDCEAVFNGVMLVRLDRLFAAGVLAEAGEGT